jgi:hypothetical protein
LTAIIGVASALPSIVHLLSVQTQLPQARSEPFHHASGGRGGQVKSSLQIDERRNRSRGCSLGTDPIGEPS